MSLTSTWPSSKTHPSLQENGQDFTSDIGCRVVKQYPARRSPSAKTKVEWINEIWCGVSGPDILRYCRSFQQNEKILSWKSILRLVCLCNICYLTVDLCTWVASVSVRQWSVFEYLRDHSLFFLKFLMKFGDNKVRKVTLPEFWKKSFIRSVKNWSLDIFSKTGQLKFLIFSMMLEDNRGHYRVWCHTEQIRP